MKAVLPFFQFSLLLCSLIIGQAAMAWPTSYANYSHNGAASSACNEAYRQHGGSRYGYCKWWSIGRFSQYSAFTTIDPEGNLSSRVDKDHCSDVERGEASSLRTVVSCETFRYMWSCAPGQVPDANQGNLCVTPHAPGTPNTGSPDCTNPSEGNPVIISTGNKYQKAVDFVGRGPMPLHVTRNYNSALNGWRFTGQESLEISETSVLWHMVDGKTLEFIWLSGKWKVLDRPKLELTQESDGSWQLRDEDLRIYMFSSEGALRKVSESHGTTHTYSYSSDGRLRTIRHSNDDMLTYSYGISGEISSITTQDGAAYTYYFRDGQLRNVVFPEHSGKVTYHYENTGFPFALTGITDEKGLRYAHWGYDAQGRVVLSEHHGGAGRTTFMFNGNSSTTVTTALGKSTTYRFAEVNGVNKLTSVEGHASANCAAASKSYTYTPEGLVETRINWRGRTTRFSYNSRGLEVRRAEAEGTSQEHVVITEWDPVLPLKSRVIESSRETLYTYDNNGNLLEATIRKATP